MINTKQYETHTKQKKTIRNTYETKKDHTKYIRKTNTKQDTNLYEIEYETIRNGIRNDIKNTKYIRNTIR